MINKLRTAGIFKFKGPILMLTLEKISKLLLITRKTGKAIENLCNEKIITTIPATNNK